MAAFPATLHVSWVSNYVGNHRVCYKLLGELIYDCTTIVNCPVAGDTYTADIAVLLDNERCDDMIFEIYVQATCNAETSETGRIDASTTFVPTPTCVSYLLTCVDDAGGTQCLGETHDNCTGGTTSIPTSLTGATYYICSTIAPKVPQAGWTIVADPATHCCYDCVNVSFLMDRGFGPSEIVFMSCIDGLYTTAVLPEGITITACMVRDTWYFTTPADEANCTITIGTVCDPWSIIPPI
jgi:hypothetical protein